MAKRIKLQHYVPKFYLKSFSIEDKTNFLYCFDKSKLHKFIVNIRNIANETYFYDTSQDDNQHFEKFLSYCEYKFKSVYEKLIEFEDIDNMTAIEKKWMATFIAVQLVRTKEHRIVLKSGIEQLKRSLSQRGKEKELLDELHILKGVDDEETIKYLHIKSFNDIPSLVFSMLEKKWILLKNKTEMPYWSSDNPVNPPNVKGYLSDFSSPLIQIQIPLSSEVALFVCDKNQYNVLQTRYEINDIQKIEFLNSLQVYWSTRYIFSSEGHFTKAEQAIRDNLYLSDIYRERGYTGLF